MSQPELRFVMPAGYLRLRLPSRADAVKALVLTRSCGAGFFYDWRFNNIIAAKSLKPYTEVSKILKREGYCNPNSG